jgi:hypothetical protein
MKEMFHFQNSAERRIGSDSSQCSDERFQLLAFCTGTPSFPQPELLQPEIRVRVLDCANLPIAHIWISKLELSRCEIADDMEKKTRIAIE